MLRDRLSLVIAAAGLGAFLMAFLVIEWSISHPIINPDTNQSQNEIYQDRADKNCSVIPVEYFWKRTRCDPAAFVTLWLVIVTAFLVAATSFLWFVTHQIRRDARDASMRELRAYMAVEDIYFLYYGENRTDGTMRDYSDIQRMRFTNFGKTPATDLRIWVRRGFKEPTEDMVFSAMGAPDFTPHLLGPTRRFGTRIPMVRGFGYATHFFTYGRIEYRDIYGRWFVQGFAYEHFPSMTPRHSRFNPHRNLNDERPGGPGRDPAI
jgi:hypothetical protein